MQAWIYRLPRAGRAAITAALAFGAMFGVMELDALDEQSAFAPHSLVARLVMAAVVGLFTGVVGVVFGDHRIRRIYGSTEHAITYLQTLRTGQPPRGIEPAVWRRWINASRQSMKWTPATVALYVVLAALNSLDHHWSLALVLAVLAIWFLGFQWVLRRRVLRLEAALDDREAASS
jgi:C4-dicarboxylate-specific signal transduction histidine kinase